VYPPQLVVQSLDSSCIALSVQRAMLGRLVVVGAIEITIPFVMALVLKLVSLLATILDLVMTISIADDILNISLTLVALVQ
jgi:hypothetical protein